MQDMTPGPRPNAIRTGLRRVGYLCFLLALAALHLATTSSSRASAQATVLLASRGQIGHLQLDRSSKAAIIAASGAPDAARTGRFAGEDASYVALGYSCHRANSRGTFGLTTKGPFCATAFFVSSKTGRLADFFTGSGKYVGPHGLRVGTSSSVAERLLHQRLRRACDENLSIKSSLARLTIEFAGGSEGNDRSVVGAHIEDFVLTSRRHDVGVYAYLC
jgi:hypothetical protein